MRNVRVWCSVLFLGIGTFACCQNGHLGASQNIAESKKMGVFICEYAAPRNPYYINDTLSLNIREAWVEKKWRYSSNSINTITPFDEYQILVDTYEEDLVGFPINWSIGNSVDLYLRPSSKSGMIGDFKAMPNDTLVYPVLEGEMFSRNMRQIGILELIKKE